MVVAAGLDEPARLADLAASNLDLKVEEAEKVLETTTASDRLRIVLEVLRREIRVLTVQQEITGAAKGEIDKSQREYFLRQQLKAIHQELGDSDDLADEIASYRKAVTEKRIPEEATQEIEKQIKRLERGSPDSAENATIRTWLDWITGLPWAVVSTDSLDLDRARRILDEDHYDLEKVKERILEFLAVRKLAPESKGPILCFVGPPGVGKTSLGRSIARARCPGRGRDPGPPEDVRRRPPGADHPEPLAGGDLQPRLHARRGRQDRRRLPGRPLVGSSGGPRPGAEPLVP
jgi:ATP-dependent Lon protease